MQLNDALSHSGEKPFSGPGFVNYVTKCSCQEESHRTTGEKHIIIKDALSHSGEKPFVNHVTKTLCQEESWRTT